MTDILQRVAEILRDLDTCNIISKSQIKVDLNHEKRTLALHISDISDDMLHDLNYYFYLEDEGIETKTKFDKHNAQFIFSRSSSLFY